jgi:hypothetical protein
MPVRAKISGVEQWLRPTEIWKTARLAGARRGGQLVVDSDFYVMSRELGRAIPDVSEAAALILPEIPGMP